MSVSVGFCDVTMMATMAACRSSNAQGLMSRYTNLQGWLIACNTKVADGHRAGDFDRGSMSIT